MIRLTARLACAALVLSAGSTSAQTGPKVGDLVRGGHGGKMVQGRLVEAPALGASLRLARKPGGGQFDLSWDAPALAYRVRGSQKLSSALVGLAAGGAAGAILGFASGDDVCTGWCLFAQSAEEKAFLGGILFGAAGAVTGALVGKGPIWAPIARPTETRRIGLRLSAQGAGLRITF